MHKSVSELSLNNKCLKDINSDNEYNSDSDNSSELLSPSSSYANINNIKLEIN